MMARYDQPVPMLCRGGFKQFFSPPLGGDVGNEVEDSGGVFPIIHQRSTPSSLAALAFSPPKGGDRLFFF